MGRNKDYLYTSDTGKQYYVTLDDDCGAQMGFQLVQAGSDLPKIRPTQCRLVNFKGTGLFGYLKRRLPCPTANSDKMKRGATISLRCAPAGKTAYIPVTFEATGRRGEKITY